MRSTELTVARSDAGLYDQEIAGSGRHGMATVTACLILLCFPLGLLLAGISWHQRGLVQPVHGGVTTSGVISGVTSGGVLHGRSPVVSFVTADGRRVSFTAPPVSGQPQLGTAVTVSYAPSDPAGAHDLSDTGARWPLGAIIGLLIASLGEWYFWRLVFGFGRHKS